MTVYSVWDFWFCRFWKFLVWFFSFFFFSFWCYSVCAVCTNLVFGFQFMSTIMSISKISLSNAFYGFSGFGKEITPSSWT